MSYYDEDEGQVAVQAFGGLLQHVRQYSGQMRRLKKGHPSGISSMFGRAIDLLPDECLQELLDDEQVYEVGDSIFAEDVDLDVLQEMLKGYFEEQGEVPDEEETARLDSQPELMLDESGENVTYETMDGAAVIALKTRQLV